MKTIQVITLAAAAAIAAPAANAAGDDGVGTAGDAIFGTALTAPLAASSSSQDVPATFYYSQDPSNLFSPVYTIKPIGPEDVTATGPQPGELYGTQEFGVYNLGIPVDTFTGTFDYSPVSNPVDIFGNPYIDDIEVAGAAGTVFPADTVTGFLVTEFGFGYGNVFESTMNTAGTSETIGDFLLTPFGEVNISPIVEFLASYTGTI